MEIDVNRHHALLVMQVTGVKSQWDRVEVTAIVFLGNTLCWMTTMINLLRFIVILITTHPWLGLFFKPTNWVTGDNSSISSSGDTPLSDQDSPSWPKYVLSKSRMKSIKRDSTKWRLTCQYDTGSLVYTDYLFQASTVGYLNHDLTFKGCGKCTKVKKRSFRSGWHNPHTACTGRDMVLKNNISLRDIKVEAFSNNKSCFFKLTAKTHAYPWMQGGIGYYRCVGATHHAVLQRVKQLLRYG